MVNFNQLFTLAAFGTGMVSALHIDFKRYQDNNCTPDHHIRKTTDLHDTTCKSFTLNELAYHSFNFKVTKHGDDMTKKDCRLVVFDGEDCKGKAFTYGGQSISTPHLAECHVDTISTDMKDMENACASVPLEGRSVRLECGKKKQQEVKTLTPKPTPSPSSTKTLTHHPTVTVTHTHEVKLVQPDSTTEHVTMTVVPKRRIQHCQTATDDDDWWPPAKEQ